MGFFWFWPHPMACGILVPWPGIELLPPAMKRGVLSTGLTGKSQNKDFKEKTSSPSADAGTHWEGSVQGTGAQTRGSGLRRWPPGRNALVRRFKARALELKNGFSSLLQIMKTSHFSKCPSGKKILLYNLKKYYVYVCVCTLIHTYWVGHKVHLGFFCKMKNLNKLFGPSSSYFSKKYLAFFSHWGNYKTKLEITGFVILCRISLLTLKADPLTLISLLKLYFVRLYPVGSYVSYQEWGRKSYKMEVQWEATHIHTLTYMLTN